MKNLLCVGLVLAIAGTAMAEPLLNSPVDPNWTRGTNVRPNLTMTKEVIGSQSGFDPRISEGAIYDSDRFDGAAGTFGAGGYFSNPLGAASFFADDYVSGGPLGGGPVGSLAPLGANNTELFRFVGGVGDTGQALTFTFFNVTGTAAGSPTTFTIASSFNVPFPQGGNFIWTFSFSSLSTLPLPNHGLFQVYVVTAGNMFLTQTYNVTVGSNGSYLVPGYTTAGSPLVGAFAFHVPEPATASLVALGGLVLGIRRRRNKA